MDDIENKNIMEELSQKPVMLSETEEKLIELVHKEVNDKVHEEIENINVQHQERIKEKNKSLSKAVWTFKNHKGQLESDIGKLIEDFEFSSGLKISKIDISPNPRTQNYGFKDHELKELPSPFGFQDETKSPRKFIITVTIEGL